MIKQKANDINKNVVEKINHSEYEYVLLDNKCLRQLMNIIRSKNYKIRTYEINTISFSCFNEKIYILKIDMMISSWLLELIMIKNYFIN